MAILTPKGSSRLRLLCERLEDRVTPTTASAIPASAFLPDGVNVVMAASARSAADASDLAAAPFAASVDYLGFGIYRVTLAAGTTSAAAVAYYSARPNVVGAAADARVQVEQIPNDPSYTSLWGMNAISAPTAWDTTTGTGAFTVAVADTGIDYTHQDLANNVWINQREIPAAILSTLTDVDADGVISFRDLNAPQNAGKVADANGNGYSDAGDILRAVSVGGWQDGADADGNGYIDDLIGYDFANNDNNPADDNGHGTHVSGTIAAVGNNGVGVVGVNWAAGIMTLKFLDSGGSGYVSNAVRALDYAVAAGVKLSNHSWGGASASSTLSSAIGRAKTAGHILVAAAGNSGLNIETSPSYPASYSTSYNNVVTVAATDSTDTLASWSNYGGTSVTLAAPGVSILSTTPNNGYSYYSGTSMATPHVAGALALLWSFNPSWTYTQVIDKLKSSVDPVAGLVGKVLTGGRLNVAALLEGTGTTPAPAVAPGPVVTTAAFSGTPSADFRQVRFTFDRAVDPTTFTAVDIADFTGPNGAITAAYTVSAVAGTNNTQFDVTFTPQTAAGTYRMVIGPDIRDGAGNPMNQDGDGTAGELTDDQFTASGTLSVVVVRTLAASNLPMAINNYQTTRSSLTVTEGIKITDLNVQVSIQHPNLKDLTIRLKSPAGVYVTLFNKRGGSGDNLTNTVFDDEAGTAINSPSASAPYTGSFRPEQPLSAFDGSSGTGTWTLEVYDGARRNTGFLTAWSLTITGTTEGGGQGARVLGFHAEPTVLADTVSAFGVLTGVAEAPPSRPTVRWLAPAAAASRFAKSDEIAGPPAAEERSATEPVRPSRPAFLTEVAFPPIAGGSTPPGQNRPAFDIDSETFLSGISVG